MSYTNTLKESIQLQNIDHVFLKGNKGESIKDLQHMLYEMGFAIELKWDKYGADGDYGNCTKQALIAFGKKNDIPTDGQKIIPKLAQRLIDRYDLLDSLNYLKNTWQEETLDATFNQNVINTKATSCLQILLSELGFNELPINGIYDDIVVLALKTFGSEENILTNGRALNDELTTRIFEKFAPFYGDSLSLKKMKTFNSNLSFSEITKGNKKYVLVTDNEKEIRFTKSRGGLFTYGTQKLFDFLHQEKEQLVGNHFTLSAINVLISVAENEGNLDAINTYDNSFLSFGIFQWTLGANGNSGELPALLKNIKIADEGVFNRYFGKFGIDVSNDTNKTYGFLTKDGSKINSTGEKEPFRKPDWAFRFWNAGQNFKVKAVEAQHAINRLYTFYWRKNVNGFSLSELITSEYGVALILDNHVNRPGYLRKCVAQAMNETGLDNPGLWSSNDEKQLVDAYLRIRETFGSRPMTDAAKRARSTKKYLDQGIISAGRGSFKIGPRTRGMKLGSAPSFINLDDYSEIRDYDEE